MHSLKSVCVCGVLGLLGCNAIPMLADLRAGPSASSTLTTRQAGLLIFDGSVNDRPARILIDTGSALGICGATRVVPFGLRPSSINPIGLISPAGDACSDNVNGWPLLFAADRVRLGDFEFADVPFLVLDRLPPEITELGVDFVLGASAMSSCDWELTDEGKKLILHRPGSLPRPGAAFDLIHVNFRAPLLRWRIDTLAVIGSFDGGTPVPLIVDSGYTGMLGTTELVASLAGVGEGEEGIALPISSWSTTCFGRTVVRPQSEIGGRTFDDLAVDILPSDEDFLSSYFGLLGLRLLAAHHVRCSPVAGWIDLEATADTPTLLAAPPVDFGFLAVRRDNGRLGVRYVLAGSPADQAGLRVGDIIERVGGASVVGVPAFDLIPFSPAAGQTIELEVRREGGLLTISIAAAPI